MECTEFIHCAAAEQTKKVARASRLCLLIQGKERQRGTQARRLFHVPGGTTARRPSASRNLATSQPRNFATSLFFTHAAAHWPEPSWASLLAHQAVQPNRPAPRMPFLLCIRRETFFGKPFAADGFMKNGLRQTILLRAAHTGLQRSDIVQPSRPARRMPLFFSCGAGTTKRKRLSVDD